MRGDQKTRRDGSTFTEYRYSTDDLDYDVRRFRLTSNDARKRIEHIQRLFGRLLDPKLTDARRVGIVNVLRRRLVWHHEVDNLAALSKIAHGQVDPRTLQFVSADTIVPRSETALLDDADENPSDNT